MADAALTQEDKRAIAVWGARNLLNNCGPSWLPGLDECFSVTLTPEERAVLLELLSKELAGERQ